MKKENFYYQQGDGVVHGCMYKRSFTRTSIVRSEDKVEWFRGLKDRPESYELLGGAEAYSLEIGF